MQALILVNGEIRDEWIATGIQALQEVTQAQDDGQGHANAQNEHPDHDPTID